MYIEIPGYVTVLMDRLSSAGEESYVVGGGLRDSLLGKRPDDYDVATSASPERMVEIFSDFRVIETGLKHGTLTVISEGRAVEITAFRVDGDYTDSRHPDSVSFTRSVGEDLARRDFTVNAMAYNHGTGLIDLFGGIEDLERGVIRAVRDPELRFGEDALRIMRAFRFSAQLGFEIEENTLRATGKCRRGLANIARERISAEFFKLICAVSPQRPLLQMKTLGILPFVLGDCSPSDKTIELLPKMPVHDGARLGFLLSGCTGEQIRATLDGLRCSNRQRSRATAVAANAYRKIADPRDVSKLCAGLGDSTRHALCASVILGASDEKALAWLDNDRAPHSTAQLEISGDELVRMGFEGREIGKTLAYLLECAIESPELNTRERLSALALDLAREKYTEKGNNNARKRYNYE